MVNEEKEIECIKNAREPGIANPDRSRQHFSTIIEHFFRGYDFCDKAIMDLGPGHYDFGELITPRGALVEAIELDPAVIKLGEMKGFKVTEGDLSDGKTYDQLSGKFNGLFCRGSINACWHENIVEQEIFLSKLISIVKKDGFFWISPCNDSSELPATKYKMLVAAQVDFFKQRDFKVIFCNNFFTSYYGIYSSSPKLIFYKNLKFNYMVSILKLLAHRLKANV